MKKHGGCASSAFTIRTKIYFSKFFFIFEVVFLNNHKKLKNKNLPYYDFNVRLYADIVRFTKYLMVVISLICAVYIYYDY